MYGDVVNDGHQVVDVVHQNIIIRLAKDVSDYALLGRIAETSIQESAVFGLFCAVFADDVAERCFEDVSLWS